MKKTAIFLFLIFMLPVLAVGQVSFGKPEKINENWRFILQDVKNGEEKNFNDSRWEKIDLPHDWSVKGLLSPTLASCTGYLPGGIGWYRKTLNIPKERENEKVYLYFEGVYNRSEVFVNGHSIGKRPNGYISFLYDATPYVVFGEYNIIAVRVDHSRSADSRWYTGSGIYRNVWAVYSNPVHVAQWGVYAYPTRNKNQHSLNMEVEVENETSAGQTLTVVNELLDKNKKVVARSSRKIQTPAYQSIKLTEILKVKNPELWSLDNPYLYELKTTLLQEGKVIDTTVTNTGFRYFTFNPDKGFALNDTWMKVKGVCLHHDAGLLGSAVYRDVWKRRLTNLKEIGVNAIRTSHNPQAPDIYQLCDELGMLVIDEAFDEWEFPKRKWIEGWNKGTPGFQGTFDFFEEWGEKDLADMVRRDRNHVSVFAWSVGNEVDYPNDPYSHPILAGDKEGFTQPIFGGYKKEAPDAMRLGAIAKKLVTVVKQYDKSRPTTAGLAGVAMSNETEYPGELDIAGYNYTESMYDRDHKKYPQRVIFGSENRHELSAWKAARDKDFIFGQFLWTGIDYLGESGSWPSRGFYSGLLDFGGFIKPRGFFRQSLWSDKPMAYLGTYPTPVRGSRSQMKDVWSQLDAENSSNYEEKVPSMDAWPVWNYTDGQLIRVVCYTNAPKARLLLNGKEVGQIQSYNENTGIIFWDIPYENGTLSVQGLDKNDKEISHYQIKSSKQPYALQITSADKSVSKDQVAHVTVQVVDENGIPVMLSDNEITCRIVGDGKLLGLEASNNEDMSDYNDNKHRVFHGRIMAYIKPVKEEGNIRIKFTSPWLESAETEIQIK